MSAMPPQPKLPANPPDFRQYIANMSKAYRQAIESGEAAGTLMRHGGSLALAGLDAHRVRKGPRHTWGNQADAVWLSHGNAIWALAKKIKNPWRAVSRYLRRVGTFPHSPGGLSSMLTLTYGTTATMPLWQLKLHNARRQFQYELGVMVNTFGAIAAGFDRMLSGASWSQAIQRSGSRAVAISNVLTASRLGSGPRATQPSRGVSFRNRATIGQRATKKYRSQKTSRRSGPPVSRRSEPSAAPRSQPRTMTSGGYSLAEQTRIRQGGSLVNLYYQRATTKYGGKLATDANTISELRKMFQRTRGLSGSSAMQRVAQAGEFRTLERLLQNPAVGRVQLLRPTQRRGDRTPDARLTLRNGDTIHVETNAVTGTNSRAVDPPRHRQGGPAGEPVTRLRFNRRRVRAALASKLRHGQISSANPGVIVVHIQPTVPANGRPVLSPVQVRNLERLRRRHPGVQGMYVTYRVAGGVRRTARVGPADSGLALEDHVLHPSAPRSPSR